MKNIKISEMEVVKAEDIKPLYDGFDNVLQQLAKVVNHGRENVKDIQDHSPFVIAEVLYSAMHAINVDVKIFLVLALYKKTILNANGQKDSIKQTIRIIKAKDRNEAKDKFNKFWAEKMRSFTVVNAELTEVIE